LTIQIREDYVQLSSTVKCSIKTESAMFRLLISVDVFFISTILKSSDTVIPVKNVWK